MKRSGIVTLLTDFGLHDPYVAMMKGVILSLNPKASIVDVTHEVGPGDITTAAQMVLETFPWFPEGTIHVAVVDPGVGTGRRPIVLAARSHFFVGPDNGIFWPIIDLDQHCEIVHITNTGFFLPHVSRTFHGRDIFAPVAAHLARGADPVEVGEAVNDPVRLSIPRPSRKGQALHGHVIRVDRFGNLITDIHRRKIEEFGEGGPLLVRVGGVVIGGVLETYADAGKGELLCLFGSSGYLEIAVNLGRASDRLGASGESVIGSEVIVTRVP